MKFKSKCNDTLEGVEVIIDGEEVEVVSNRLDIPYMLRYKCKTCNDLLNVRITENGPVLVQCCLKCADKLNFKDASQVIYDDNRRLIEYKGVDFYFEFKGGDIVLMVINQLKVGDFFVEGLNKHALHIDFDDIDNDESIKLGMKCSYDSRFSISNVTDCI